jgi:hypothetical protein
MSRAAAKSTAKFISYDLRPAKQSERRILLDLMQVAGDCGFPITNYRYVGMGANRFYDFLLIHKYLGINKMISLEHDPIMYGRAMFNRPYSFIDVRNDSISNFIETDSFTDKNLLWFDYDGGIGSDALADISALSTKLNKGDFCFITIGGLRPPAYERSDEPKVLAWMKDEFGDFAGEVTATDVEKKNFPEAARKVLLSAFRYAFSTRQDCKFVPFLQVKYTDSFPMVTIGGALMDDDYSVRFKEIVDRTLPFLRLNEERLYEIKSLNLTERERVLFDRATTHSKPGSIEKNQRQKIKKLGFTDEEINAYKELIRYLPRYVETIV